MESATPTATLEKQIPMRLELLEDLEVRQDELIRQLDELDQKIELTLKQFQIQNRPRKEAA